jgi:hypothetical protein
MHVNHNVTFVTYFTKASAQSTVMLNWSRNLISSTQLPFIELCSVIEPLTVVNSDWTASKKHEKYLQEITRVRYVSVSYIEIPPPPLSCNITWT